MAKKNLHEFIIGRDYELESKRVLRNLWGVFANVPLRAAFFGWFIAQLLKVPIYYYVDGKLDWRRVTSSGGMPSSHSAAICAATTSIGMLDGFNSSIFALAVVMSVVVMYDAAGVRRAAGKHAVVLNELIMMFQGEGDLTDEKLKEWIGHTPFEVLIGCWLGIMVGIGVTLIFVAAAK